MKKYISGIVLGFLLFSSAPQAFAITADELQTQITSIKSQIETLQAKLSELQRQLTGANTANPSERALEVASPMASFNRTLRVGIKGDDVKTVQQVLIEKGYLNDTIDGSFGRKTGEAVKAYQRANNLKDDGVLGPRTLELIKTLIAGSTGSTARIGDFPVPLGGPRGPVLPGKPLPNICLPGISKSSITVVSPNGREVYHTGQWVPGDKVLIKWNTCNISPTQTISLDLTNSLPGWSHSVTAGVPNTGSYTWTIPSQNTIGFGNLYYSGPNWKISAKVVGTSIADLSDDWFEINNDLPGGPFPVGCTSASGISTITGLPCSTPPLVVACNISNPLSMVADPTTPVSQTVSAGTSNFEWARVDITSKCDLTLSQIMVEGDILPGRPAFPPSYFTNLNLYDFTTGVQLAQISNTPPQSYNSSTSNSVYYYLYPGLKILAGQTIKLAIRSDINPVIPSGTKASISFTTIDAVDSSSNKFNYMPQYAIWGNPMTIGGTTQTCPNTTLTIDASTPASQTFPAGSIGVDFAHFKVTAYCSVNINDFTFSVGPMVSAGNFKNIKLFSGGLQLGSTIAYGIPSPQTFTVGNGFTIPANSSVMFVVKADINPSAQSGDTMEISANGLTAIETSTGISKNVVASTNASGNTMTVGSNCSINPALNSSSPSGLQSPGVKSDVIKINITTSTNCSVSIDKLYFNAVGNFSNVYSQISTVYLYDGNTLLSTVTNPSQSNQGFFSLGVLPPGFTKTFTIKADTSGFVSGQTLQFSVASIHGADTLTGTSVDYTTPVMGKVLTY